MPSIWLRGVRNYLSECILTISSNRPNGSLSSKLYYENSNFHAQIAGVTLAVEGVIAGGECASRCGKCRKSNSGDFGVVWYVSLSSQRRPTCPTLWELGLILDWRLAVFVVLPLYIVRYTEQGQGFGTNATSIPSLNYQRMLSFRAVRDVLEPRRFLFPVSNRKRPASPFLPFPDFAFPFMPHSATPNL